MPNMVTTLNATVKFTTSLASSGGGQPATPPTSPPGTPPTAPVGNPTVVTSATVYAALVMGPGLPAGGQPLKHDEHVPTASRGLFSVTVHSILLGNADCTLTDTAATPVSVPSKVTVTSATPVTAVYQVA